MLEVRLGSENGRTRRVAFLREPSGRDEMLLEGDGPMCATALLDCVLVDVPGAAAGTGQAWKLPLGERDRLIAALHARCFGDRIECVVTCRACGESFEASFSLSALLANVESERAQPGSVRGPDADNQYTLPDGSRFRLPTAEDERAVAAFAPEEGAVELLRRCTSHRGATTTDEDIQRAMESLSPALDRELTLRCAGCGTMQVIRFDVISFFTSALRRERALLAREIHCLAAAYHWPLDDILGLPRSVRREQVSLIEAGRGGKRARR